MDDVVQQLEEAADAAALPRGEHTAMVRIEQLAREELAALAPLYAPAPADLLETCLAWDLGQGGDQLA